MNNTKQEWKYHSNKPTKGRKLLLLQRDEIVIALPLIFRLIPREQILKRLDWFESGAESETKFLKISELLSLVTRKRSADLRRELEQLNFCLNEMFSDYGWRMVRKELAQIKKRKKKSHIELSNDLIHRLKAFMSIKQLDSFDQALDFLLSECEQLKIDASKEGETT